MRGNSTNGETTVTRTSTRLTTGTTANVKVCGVTAVPTVEQIWQGCELAGPEFRSAQKWNCAARKANPSSSAPMPILLSLGNIFVLRRSLGRIGCGVK